MNVTHMPKLIKKNYPQQLWLPFMLAKAEISLGKVNISKTTMEKLTQSAGIGLILKQTDTQKKCLFVSSQIKELFSIMSSHFQGNRFPF